MNSPESETSESPDSGSHLLLIRAWREEMGQDQFEWRAQIRHVLSGEARYIRRWQDLINFLDKLEEKEINK